MEKISASKLLAGLVPADFIREEVQVELVKELQPSAPDAVITEGRLLNHGTKQEISAWINSL